MLWLAIHLPKLALESLARSVQQEQQPFVVIEQARISKVVACNSVACLAGIYPGIPLTAAQALAPGLLWQMHRPRLVQQALQQLGLWAMRFTPNVCLDPAPGLLLEIAGCLAYFGGLTRLHAQIHSGLHELGFQPQIALASNPTAAMLLAQSGAGHVTPEPADLPSALNPLPLALLVTDQRNLDWLHGIGVSTLGACQQLPRAGLARRLGPELLQQLDQAYGMAPDPREPLQAPASFQQQLELSYPVEQAEALLFAGRRLCEAAAGFLARHAGGARRLRFELCQRPPDNQLVDIGVVSASRSADYFLALLREHLQQIKLERPVEILRLEIIEWEPLAGASQALPCMDDCNNATDSEAWAKLLSRLQARFGESALQRPAHIDEHRPEQALTLQEATELSNPAEPNPQLLRPLWLLPQPEPLAEVDGVPLLQGRLHLGESIERIEAGWWDEQPVRRDYYLAQAEASGARYWVFRDHVSGDWYLHGVFG